MLGRDRGQEVEHADAASLATPDDPLKRPMGRYIIGLAAIAVLVVLASVLTARALSRQELDAGVINAAAGQVVLGQRIAETASLAVSTNGAERTQALAVLASSLAELERIQRGLQFGDPELELPGANSADMQMLFASIQRAYGELRSSAWAVLDEAAANLGVDRTLVATVGMQGDLFEAAMESVVFGFQTEAEERVVRLRKTQYALLSGTLVLLLLEGLFLFRPAARQVRESWEEQNQTHRSERAVDQRKLSYLARYDPLTDLINRTLFTDRLQGAVARARRDGGLVSLMFLDLDHFKAVNDRYGHATGDALLKQVAARLTASVRESDTVARLGGDEFTVVLEGNHRVEDAGRVATKILSALSVPYTIGHRELFITASIGIALYPIDGDEGEELLKDADIAMYSAKSAGRNTYQYFTPELRAQTTERLHLIDGLRRAIERGGELELHYQPKVDTSKGTISGFEALLRWNHPERGLIEPGRFIPLAEETDLIIPIGEWVLREATHQMRAWLDAGFPVMSVSVNISARQFRQGNLVETVESALDEAGLDPRHLELELTEGVLMEDTELARRTLERLRRRGVQVSIDDFGTGYSSLSYLRRFPIDTLKIDRSFINDLIGNQDDAAISAAIVGLARALRMNVIAEGVETEEQLAYLTRLGCVDIQGFLISRPLAAVDVPAFVDVMVNMKRTVEAATYPA